MHRLGRFVPGFLRGRHWFDPRPFRLTFVVDRVTLVVVFFPSTSAFPYHYHSTNAAYSSSATRCPYWKGKRAKPRKLARKNFSSGYRGAFDIHVKVLSLFSYFKVFAMAQPYFRRPLTAVARVRIQAIPCEICDGENITGTDFSPTTSFVRGPRWLSC